jgi:parallel beta-helix repeat protein
MSRSTKLQRRSPGRKFDRTRRARARWFRPLLELLESYQLLSVSTFIVTNTADLGTTDTTLNNGTLRGAIEAANAVGAGNSAIIDFDIGCSSVQTITLFAGESLPSIVVPTILDGFSQGGGDYGGSPLIVISGIAVPGANGITLDGNLSSNASGSTIEGLSIVNFHEGTVPPSTGVSGAGIYLTAQAGDDHIGGNYLGILPNGTTVASNDYGIAVSSSGNTIGGAGGGVDNVISGNRTGGIALFGQIDSGTGLLAPVVDTLIEGNDIGTNATGTAAEPNGTAPTTIVNGGPGPGYGIGLAVASDNTIGGTGVDDANVISGNDGYGIDMTGFVGDISGFDNTSDQAVPTTDNLVEGNLIGTTAAGTAALGNKVGIVMAGATDNTIGGTTAAATNVISANGVTLLPPSVIGPAVTEFPLGVGVAIVGAFNGVSDTADLVEGNFIGTNVAGNSPMGNAGDGIYVGVASAFDTAATGVASAATIGGSATGAGNIIAANAGDGIAIDGTALADSAGDLVLGNSIGAFYNGTAGGYPSTSGNTSIAVSADYVSGLTIFDNTIENSGSVGVSVFDSTATTIGGTATGAGNFIFGNAGDGIEIGADNTSAAFPATIIDNEIDQSGADGVLVTGGNITITIQGDQIQNNASNGIEIDGESNFTIGGIDPAASNIIASNSSNGILINRTSSVLPSTGDLIQGNQIGIPGGKVVLGPDDDAGDGNNEAGISASNTSGLTVVGNTIQFNGVGVSISSSTGTTIGGTALGAGNMIAASDGDGLELIGDHDSFVAGNTIETNGNSGVFTSGGGSGTQILSNTIEANIDSGIFLLGGSLDFTIQGNTIEGNQENGIAAQTVTGITIGGTAAGAGNLIVDNDEDGIQLEGTVCAPSIGDLIEDNLIGVQTSSGTPAPGSGNGEDGVYVEYSSGVELFGNTIDENGGAGDYDGPGVAIEGSTSATIGGTAAGAANVIADNLGDGLDLIGDIDSFVAGDTIKSNGSTGVYTSSSGSGTQILSNTIVGNAYDGIYLSAGSLDFTIQGNTVGGSGEDGLRLISATNATIGGTTADAGNVISNNAQQGIDLQGTSATPVTGDVIEGNTIGGAAGSGNLMNGIFAEYTSGLTISGNTVTNNQNNGINLQSSSGTIIGGTTKGEGNLFSANAEDGFAMSNMKGFLVLDNTMAGNGGTGANATGSGSVAGTMAGNTINSNGARGIYVAAGTVGITLQDNTVESNNNTGIAFIGSGATIGGAIAGAGNVIASNGEDGIDLEGTSGLQSFDDVIEGNTIGGAAAASGNAGNGINLAYLAQLTIKGNTIEFNTGAGVALLASGPSTGVVISQNSIYENGALGIDLDQGGAFSGLPLPNDSDIANNNGQNYPVLTSVAVTSTGTTVTGTLNNAKDKSFTIEFFSIPTADPSGSGQGQTYLTSTTVTTNGSGRARFSASLGSSVPIGTIISATATSEKLVESSVTPDASVAINETSEFSLNVIALPTTATTVTSTPDPSVFGQSVTFTATVAAVTPGTGTPTGTVSFFDGATPLGAGTLTSPGVWSISTVALAVGAHPNITADYSGDANFLPSDSPDFLQTVDRASTTTTVTSAPNPSLVGQSVTFTATVMAAAPGAGTPTGTVDFFDDGTSLGAGTLTSPGVWTFSTAALAVGAHPDITADYSGDANFVATDSPNFLQTVDKASAAVTLTSAPNPSTFGQSVTFTATVAAVAPGAGLPTGTVTFFDDATSLGTGTLVCPGVWTFSTAALAAGAHPDITADYSGDANFVAADSPNFLQTVGQASTTATVTSAPNPSIFGQSLTFTATVGAVAPGAGTPTGTVTFFDGATSLGTGTLTSPGVWTLSTAALAAGSHPDITADYSGDANFVSSDSPHFLQTVDAASTTTTVTSTRNPSDFGQSVTLTATVAAVAPGAGTPTQLVEFLDGGTPLGAGTLTSPGVWTFSTAALAVGAHPDITAVYSGDANFLFSQSPDYLQTVDLASTTTTVTSSVSPSVFGQSVTLTATVAAVAPGAGTPTGTVTFFDGKTPLGTGTLTSPGVWTLSPAALAVGAHPDITADYSGDADFVLSDSPDYQQTVNQASSLTTVTDSSPNPSSYGQSVTFTATVAAAAPGAGIPTGTVDFFDGALELGAATLVSPGLWTFSTASLAGGPHADITADYSGDSNFLASDSPAFTQTVDQASSLTTITASSPNPSVYGQPVTFTATVAAVAPAVGTPTGTVTFYDGETELGTATLVSPGLWTFSTGTLTAGPHADITADYSGDSDFLGDDAPAYLQTVTQAISLSTLISSGNPARVGDLVTFTDTVTPVAPGGGTPTGSVTFYNGTAVLGTGTLVSPGVWSFSTADLPVTSSPGDSITAVYSGDGNFVGSTSAAIAQVINKSPAIGGTIVSSLSQAYFGQAVTLTANFSATSAGSAPMTGTVDFYDGTTFLGSAPLNATGASSVQADFVIADAQAPTVSGASSLSTSTLGMGEHTITAIYSGDANYAGATSEAPVSVDVISNTTTTTLTSTTTSQGTTLFANVVVTSPGDSSASGTVSFYEGTTLLGTEPLVNGVASLNVGALPAGAGTFTAVFSGGVTSASSQGSLVISTDGPKVTAVARYGFHDQSTYLMLSFDSSLTPALAETVSNYVIIGPGGHRMKVASAIYDPATNTVTLVPAERLSIHKSYRLTVNGEAPSGLTNLAGLLLDGSATGQPDGNFVTSLTWRSLAGRAKQLPTLGMVHAAARAAAAVEASRQLDHANAQAAAVDHLLARVSVHVRGGHARR